MWRRGSVRYFAHIWGVLTALREPLAVALGRALVKRGQRRERM